MSAHYLRIPVLECDRSPCVVELEGFAGETIRELRRTAGDNGWSYVRPFATGPRMDICSEHKRATR
jgi:hypothetical protein